ncbi:hypothetical protein [Aneurinibacillus thermoaerophilus]|uniref:Uncharacterized protein n=2 Tax=Aneurinibacillus TaxID=55079 RepID=A0A1G7Z7U9_ANETH|nr:hypothetical protein [Aneurinibacillus thermoaerophilus]AMA72313.1 hypothetical protein ACH33_05225 [Aneurinibacillus sp. XH2]MED0674836.1 hypothetical protein [Aneurinibacillus thermoaerophilus]MED0679786.1 hypothetical protein [Aneurinibacillus thermoaerophilus]MED0735818.1 hypothetical protein [Aneurinibacillus thermoaerophilus]MED0758512.1 hypothetical protein [Aneurinibacillus thermoaerophilus]
MQPNVATIRGVCDNFQAPQERTDDVYRIVEEAKSRSEITVEEKKTMQGTLLLGFYTEHGVFRLVVQAGLPIKGRLYINGITEEEMMSNPLIRLFYGSIYLMGASGMLRLYEEGVSRDIHFREGRIYESNGLGEEKELSNILVDQYIDRQILEGRINYLLEKLNDCMIHNKEPHVHIIKQELCLLTDQWNELQNY